MYRGQFLVCLPEPVCLRLCLRLRRIETPGVLKSIGGIFARSLCGIHKSVSINLHALVLRRNDSCSAGMGTSSRCLRLWIFAFSIGVWIAGILLAESKCVEEQPSVERWGTFRPHALMSVRASVPHSPAFGIMYHAADAKKIRHLASDNAEELASFSFKRHDGRFFAEHEIEDTELNALISYTFLNKPQEDSWLLRVTGTPLDRKRRSIDLSVVFYAVAAPEEYDSSWNKSKSVVAGATPWGEIRLSDDNHFTDAGIKGDCVLVGEAGSTEGPYRLKIREPSMGGIEPTEIKRSSSFGSRRKRRRLADVHLEESDYRQFRVSAPSTDLGEAHIVEESLKSRFLEIDETILLRKQIEVDEPEESIDQSNNQRARRVFGLDNDVAQNSPVILVQRFVHVPFEIDMIFTGSKHSSNGARKSIAEGQPSKSLSNELKSRQQDFDSRFESLFALKQRKYAGHHRDFAKTALSNLLGGIGVFYGRTVTRQGDEDVMLDPTLLVTSTPSRALFPRGFLWDEGFHQLLIQRWDSGLSRACISSWLSAMDQDGWIPREQVLGLEARRRFPYHIRHLMIQSPNVANPPTLLMPLRTLAEADIRGNVNCAVNASDTNPESVCDQQTIDGICADTKIDESSESSPATANFWTDALEKAVRNVQWLQRTQAGALPNSFRWRGRSSSLKSPEGYPLTLASGLDDYPRGRRISEDERHLDLHCWVAWAMGSLATVQEVAGKSSSKFASTREKLALLLEEYHSHETISSESDIQSEGMLCDFDGFEGACFEGYVSILPLLLGLLDPTSPRVGAVLGVLENHDSLRSPAGVRSLSRKSKYYRKGDDYWTGSVWMPFNYLTLAALWTKYSVAEGPYQDRAKAVYQSLKSDVIDNALQVFSRTGYLWENYDPDDGSGKSGRQFTGWSSLIVLIYADMYEGVV